MEGQRILEALCDVRASLARLQGGPCAIEAIGTAVWTARVGRREAPHHVVVTAGLHAAEILGVAAAMACVRAAKAARREQVCFHILPAADIANVERNARQVLRDGRLASLLELESPRDLEHDFWSGAPQTEAMRAWLESIGCVDAYLSFHSASCLSGGAFFYVQGEGPMAESLIAALRAEVEGMGVPLLARDPTPVPSRVREPGFFALQDLGRSALAHVHERFAPALSMVSEIPVGIVSEEASADAYQALSRRYAGELSAGQLPTVPARLIRPSDHVRCLVEAAMHLGQWLDTFGT